MLDLTKISIGQEAEIAKVKKQQSQTCHRLYHAGVGADAVCCSEM